MKAKDGDDEEERSREEKDEGGRKWETEDVEAEKGSGTRRLRKMSLGTTSILAISPSVSLCDVVFIMSGRGLHACPPYLHTSFNPLLCCGGIRENDGCAHVVVIAFSLFLSPTLLLYRN